MSGFLKLIFLVFSLPSVAFSKNYKAVPMAQFDGVLWSFSFINKDEVLINLRSGKSYYYNLKTKEKKQLNAPKAKASGQSGLLDIHYKPINGTPYVYFTFTEKHKDLFTTSLARGIYKNKNIVNLRTLFRAKIYGDTSRHFGSRLAFKGKYLFMTIGDRGERQYAQNLSYHNGKILRLTLNGKAADGNPFIKIKGALPEIWSLGHRNPQGIDVNPTSQDIYSIEFGPRGGDELNLIQRSKNYGWPTITYGKEYWGPRIGPTHKKGLEQPITYWTPSISPSGMTFYTGDRIKEWKNGLFLACLSQRHLRYLKLKDGRVISQQKLFSKLNERIRHVRSSPDGWLYFSTDSGKLYKIDL